MDILLKNLILRENKRYFGNLKEAKEKVGVGEVKALYKPSPDSHKGQNGRLLIIGGSKRFHGAPLLAAKIASKIVDLVYFCSTPENNELIKNLKSELCEFIAISCKEVEEFVDKSDCVVVGPGMGEDRKIKETVETLLKKFPKQKFVIDADPLRIIDSSRLTKNCVVTPHAGEFKDLFSIFASKESALAMAQKYGCTVVLKGRTDIICSPFECKINTTGNQGMTKGGTGDVLAGLIAALACKNDLFLAACTGTFVNGLAGDRLKEKVSYYFNASDLVEEIPRTLKWCERY